MGTIRTIIIDDERYACERLKKLLAPYPQIQIVDYFTNSQLGLENILKHRPDLLFLDIELENGKSAFDVIDKLTNSTFRPIIILVTAYPHYSIKAIKHEVFDYLIKPVDIDELENTLERLINHFSAIPAFLEEKFKMLSEREMTVLKFVIDGKTSEEIAKFLYISINTVNTHRRNILKKTGARSVVDLLRMKDNLNA